MFKVSIVQNSKIIYEGITSKAVVPGFFGEITLLPYHCPIMVRLKSGILELDEKNFSLSDGILKFENNELLTIIDRLLRN